MSFCITNTPTTISNKFLQIINFSHQENIEKTEANIKLLSLGIQRNSYDCGMFLLYFTETTLEELISLKDDKIDLTKNKRYIENLKSISPNSILNKRNEILCILKNFKNIKS